MLAVFHTLCGTACLVLGAIVLLNTKATRLHRYLGTTYVLAMVAVNVTALCIYHLTGHVNLFHLFAILSLLMVLIGWSQVLFRRRFRRWLYRHYTYMSWSYAGLVAATANEAFVRVPALKGLVQRTGNWIILATQCVILGYCAFLLSRNKNRLQQKYAGPGLNQSATTAEGAA
jgi:uncharacterized membrane protein